MITLDAAVWADFKASLLTFLAEPGVDPKYKEALEAANVGRRQFVLQEKAVQIVEAMCAF